MFIRSVGRNRIMQVSEKLHRVVSHLLEETPAHEESSHHGHCHHVHSPGWELDGDSWTQLQAMRRMLCERPVFPELPDDILTDIDDVLRYDASHRVLTQTSSIVPQYIVKASERTESDRSPIRLSVWRGDITSLEGVSAIVNAANSALLGCFRPEHRCIDNVIHSVSGPRLRKACAEIMTKQGHQEPVGSAKVTPGFNLPSQYVIHTVGPALKPRQEPTTQDCLDLANCYASCLDAAEELPALEDGRKVIAFCCISTGLFAFPGDLAAQIATKTVLQWCDAHADTTITDIIFDVFLEQDLTFYAESLQELQAASPNIRPFLQNKSNGVLSGEALVLGSQIPQAKEWISSADYLIITAGAGLSAATGLDYMSQELFRSRLQGFMKFGFRRLYDVFGFNAWPNMLAKWGYFYSHLEMVRSWPASNIYASLLSLSERFENRYFVRTTNADGFFLKNGFPAERISTPQGQYAVLQCYAKCRPDAYVASDPLIDAALPTIDPSTQFLTDPSKVPVCQFCGGEMTICVRGGSYFNELPFEIQERNYEEFVDNIFEIQQPASVVILELGVGLNTPGVLRWPNEELVENGNGRFKLVRVGLDVSGSVPWELEEDHLAVGIQGNIEDILGRLV